MKRFFRWRSPALLPSVHQELVGTLEQLLASAERPARWQVRCRVCHHAAAQSEPGPAKDAYLVSLEAGNATAPGYVVLRADKKVLEAEASIFEIFEKTGQYRTRLAVAVDGLCFSLGDTSVRLGRVSTPSGLVGLVLEVCYLPVASPELSSRALDELEAAVRVASAGVPGQLESLDSPVSASYELPPSFTARHEALMWALAIREMVAL